MLSGTFGCPWNSAQAIVAPYLAPVVSILGHLCQQGAEAHWNGHQFIVQLMEAEGEAAGLRQGGPGALGVLWTTGILSSRWPCSQFSVSCGGLRWVPLGSSPEAAGVRGQNPVGHQLVPWGLQLGAPLPETRELRGKDGHPAVGLLWGITKVWGSCWYS